MGILGIFLLVFGFIVYKAMTHNPFGNESEDHWDKVMEEAEKENARQRSSQQQDEGSDG
jgi:hypothetical protein